MIEQAFEASTKDIPDGAAKKDGIAIGEKCAAAVHRRPRRGWRQRPRYLPAGHTPASGSRRRRRCWLEYARAKPWVMKSADQVRPVPPPDLKSEIYARDYNETKELGGAKSTKRTAEQTAAVKFWTQLNFGPAWQEVARQLSAAKKLSLADNARLFALLNMGTANTFITDWDAKFTYNFWRPVTAIRNGDQDGNDATERDAAWTPLNATPMHPEYPSQAAIIAGVSMGVFEAVFGANPSTPVVASDLIDPKAAAPLRQREGDGGRSAERADLGRHPLPKLARCRLSDGPEDRRLPGREFDQANELTDADAVRHRRRLLPRARPRGERARPR